MDTEEKNKSAKRRQRRPRKRQRDEQKKKNDIKKKNPSIASPQDSQSRQRRPESRRDGNKDRGAEAVPCQKPLKRRIHGKHGGQQSNNNAVLPKNFFKPNIEIVKDEDLIVLCWNSPTDYVPFASEEAMVALLMPRGKSERGMMRKYMFRLKEINAKLNEVGGMTLLQALSLRRHCIKKCNPKTRSMNSLGLGEDNDIRESAAIFEMCVQDYLNESKIAYWTEEEQKAMFQAIRDPGRLVGTPDFFLRRQVLLRKVRERDGNNVVLEERKINWIEVKMFYGASTIPQGSVGAVGSLVPQLKKYVKAFGPGAICFMNGCGARLAAELSDIGVTVLDCSASIALARVQEHQRKWCASKDGRILN